MFKNIDKNGWVKIDSGQQVCMSNDGILLIAINDEEGNIFEVPLKSLLKGNRLYLSNDEINEMKVTLCKIIMKI